MQDVALAVEGVEQIADLLDAVHLAAFQQVGFPGHHVIGVLAVLAQRLAGDVHGRLHEHVHLRAVRVHGAQQPLADIVQVAAGVGLVDVVGGLAQLHLGVVPAGLDNAVLHLGAVDHQHHQHPLAGKGQKLHLPQGGHVTARHRHQARHAGQFRQAARGLGDQRLGRLVRCQHLAQLVAQAGVIRALHGAGRQQGVHVKPVAAFGGHPAGGGMGAGQQPHVFQFRHQVTDGGRADRQAAAGGQGLGAHRLAVADVALHQRHQQPLFAFVQFQLGHTSITRDEPSV